MQEITLFTAYNNYFNKILKRTHLNDPSSMSDYPSQSFKINFNPNDGVNTQVVLNTDGDIGEPDYAVVENEDETKTSWFILEAQRTRLNQYQLTLKRDLLADYYGTIRTAPVFVQKGMLAEDDPRIFTKESMEYNQIKKRELLLKDKTDTPWIVAYCSKSDNDTHDISVNTSGQTIPTIESLGLVLVDTSDPTSGAYGYELTAEGIDLKGTIIYSSGQLTAFGKNIVANIPQSSMDSISSKGIETLITATSYFATTNNLNKIDSSEWANILSSYLASLKTSLNTYLNLNEKHMMSIQELDRINNTSLCKDSNDNVYQLEKFYGDTIDYKITLSSSGQSASMYTYLNAAANTYCTNKNLQRNVSGNPYTIIVHLRRINVTLTNAIVPGVRNMSVSNTRVHLLDAPYDMFCMRFSRQNLMLASQCAVNMGANIYDIQIVPYFPIQEIVTGTLRQITINVTGRPGWYSYIGTSGNGIFKKYKFSNGTYTYYCDSANPNVGDTVYKAISLSPITFEEAGFVTNSEIATAIDTSLLLENQRQPITDAESTTIDYFYWASKSSARFEIDIDPIAISNKKIQNETEMLRIYAPNYSSAYDFSPAKNGGLASFIIDFTYKPYSPFIHISPSFSGLYGDNFGDARGLICNGDFSINMISDAWKNYEISNKNYQNIFNTQIKTNDRINSINVAGSIIGTGLGALGEIDLKNKKGPQFPSMFGLASSASSIALGQASYQIQRQTSIDMFGYQLGNIKALPDTLTKVTAYNVINKYYPFIEFYDCTDVEKQAIYDKIEFNGMTVMTIGYMKDFEEGNPNWTKNYFQAELIRLDDIDAEYHLVNEINEELKKGVFL